MAESLLSWLDGWLAPLPAVLRLVLWGALGGAGTMVLYGRLSPQRTIGRARAAAHRARKQMAAYRGTDFRIVLRLARRSIALALRQVMLVAPAATLAAVPVVALVVWVNGAYSWRLPKAGETVRVRFHEANDERHLASHEFSSSRAAIPSARKSVTIRWPGKDKQPVTVYEPGSDRPALTVPLPAPRAMVRKRPWWAWVWANPAGYLNPHAHHEVVRLDLPERRIISFANGLWFGWEVPFLASLVAGALAAKLQFGLH